MLISTMPLLFTLQVIGLGGASLRIAKTSYIFKRNVISATIIAELPTSLILAQHMDFK